MTYTARDICNAIDLLDKRRIYGYADQDSHSEIMIDFVQKPEGPIKFRRRTAPGQPWNTRCNSISSNQIWRLANALNTGIPVNVDRVFAGSYNSRSVLEGLLAHTPEIYVCYPGRQECLGSQVTIKTGHKHIIWRADIPHELGVVCQLDLGENYIISEVPVYDTVYDVMPHRENENWNIDILRKHSQMQIALAEIGHALNIRTWIAVEDHGIQYNGQNIQTYPYIVRDLHREDAIASCREAINFGKHIDCLYFNGGLPFAFEVEHSTGVTPGLNRMLSFKNAARYLNTDCVIVAPDEDRELVMRKAAVPQFSSIHPLYFPYSHVEELYSFVKRYRVIRGVNDNHEFLRTFMEPVEAV